jgi:hypothetical protein
VDDRPASTAYALRATWSAPSAATSRPVRGKAPRMLWRRRISTANSQVTTIVLDRRAMVLRMMPTLVSAIDSTRSWRAARRTA